MNHFCRTVKKFLCHSVYVNAAVYMLPHVLELRKQYSPSQAVIVVRLQHMYVVQGEADLNHVQFLHRLYCP